MVLPLLRTGNNLQHADDEKHVSGFGLKLRTRNLQKLNLCFLNTLYGKNTAKIFFFLFKEEKIYCYGPGSKDGLSRLRLPGCALRCGRTRAAAPPASVVYQS